MAASIKSVADARVGDTITSKKNGAAQALPGALSSKLIDMTHRIAATLESASYMLDSLVIEFTSVQDMRKRSQWCFVACFLQMQISTMTCVRLWAGYSLMMLHSATSQRYVSANSKESFAMQYKFARQDVDRTAPVKGHFANS